MRASSVGVVAAIGVGALLLVGLARSARTSTSVDRVAGIQPGGEVQPLDTPEAAGSDSQGLGTYAGQYRVAGPQSILDVTGEMLTVTSAAGRLFVESKQGKSEMLAESEAVFRVPQYSATVTFVRDDKGQVQRMLVNLMGLKELAATRIE